MRDYFRLCTWRELWIKGVLCDVKVPFGNISMDGMFLCISAFWETEDIEEAFPKNKERYGGGGQKETAIKQKSTFAITVGGDNLFLVGETALL